MLNNVVDQNDQNEKVLRVSCRPFPMLDLFQDPTVSETEAVINNVGILMRTLRKVLTLK